MILLVTFDAHNDQLLMVMVMVMVQVVLVCDKPTSLQNLTVSLTM